TTPHPNSAAAASAPISSSMSKASATRSPCRSGYQCELAHTRLGLRAIFLAPDGPRHGGDSGGLVSKRREKPNAQASFDRNEGDNDRWSGAQAACRSRTAARKIQARTRRSAGAADGNLRGAARHFELAGRA